MDRNANEQRENPFMRNELNSWLVRAVLVVALVVGLCFGQASGGPTAVRAQARAVLDQALELAITGGDPAKVLEIMQRASQLDPTFAAPHFNMARVAETQERWDDAMGAYRKVLQVAPDSRLAARARTDLARVERIAGLWQTPDGQRRVRYDLAVAQSVELLKVEDVAGATAESLRAVQMDDTRHEGRIALADALAHSGKYDVAAQHLRIAADKAPALRSKIAAALKTLQTAKQYDEAVTAADAALAAADYPRAADLFRVAWELQPTRESCGLRMALALGFANQFDDAQRALERLVASKSPATSLAAANQLATLRTLREQARVLQASRDEAERLRAMMVESARKMGIDLPPVASNEAANAGQPSAKPPAPGGAPKPPAPGGAPKPPALKDPVLEALEKRQ